MTKVIRLTESDLVRIVKRVLKETKGSLTKSDIMNMSKYDLKDDYGILEVKGKLNGKKGSFHHFKIFQGKIYCDFRPNDPHLFDMKKNIRGLQLDNESVEFN